MQHYIVKIMMLGPLLWIFTVGNPVKATPQPWFSTQLITLEAVTPGWATLQPEAIERSFDSLLRMPAVARDEHFKAYIRLLHHRTLAEATGSAKKCIEYLLEQYASFQLEDYPDVEATFNFELGRRYFAEKQFAQAFHYIILAADGFENYGLDRLPLIEKISSDLFGFYYWFEDYSTALYWIENAIKFAQDRFPRRYFYVNNLGVTYMRLKELEKAKATYLTVMEMALASGDSVYYGIGSGNYGNILRQQGKYREALPYLYTDVAINSRQVPGNSAISCIYIAYCLLKLDSLQKAGHFINQALLLGPDWHYSNFPEYYYETKALYYRQSGDMYRHARYLDSLLQLKDSLKNLYNTRILLATSLRHKEEKLLRNQQRATLESERLKSVRNQLLVGLFFGFGTILWIVENRSRKQKFDLLTRQKAAEEQLRLARVQLDNYVMRVKAQNKMLEEVERLQQANAWEPPGEEHRLQQLEKLQASILLTDSDWRAFKTVFSTVWPQFFQQLLQQYPDLSQAELRLLALNKLQLSSREMACMLGISTDSLRKSRYRLRKKYPQLLPDVENR